MNHSTSRRSFLKGISVSSVSALAANELLGTACAQPTEAKVHRSAENGTSECAKKTWKPVSDRKIRVGIVGFGRCQFGARLGFQNHPNVTVAAVSDLIPERCAGLAKACRCEKTYPSLEELVKDDSIEAVYVATDAPSHTQHCMEVLKHGKHVACAVPAVFGSLEDAHRLFEVVKSSGRKYMLNETSAFHADCYAMRQIYNAGGFGKLIYAEGEYYHFGGAWQIPSFKNWRTGFPPLWYPTHSTAFYVAVSGGSFTEVSCLSMSSSIRELQPQNNAYRNGFGTEIALLRTSEGGMARMLVSWDTQGANSVRPSNEVGRVYGQDGSMDGMTYKGLHTNLPALDRPPLPPNVMAGGHGGGEGHVMCEFVTALLENREPMIDIHMALNMTVPGVVAHQSALKNGEWMKVPQFTRTDSKGTT